MRTVIRGTGTYVPRNAVDNERMSRLMDTNDEWIRRRTGIEKRHFADVDECTSDLAVRAAEAALADAGVDRSEIDYVVFATMTPDHYFPGSGSQFHEKLGLPPVPCLDIRQQCAGFLYGLQVANALIQSGAARRLLLVGAEVHGGFMPWSWDVVFGETDRDVTPEEFENNTRFRDRIVLFGDAAGVFVLSADDGEGTTIGDRSGGEGQAATTGGAGKGGGRGLIDVDVRTDGSLADKMIVHGGGSRFRPYFDAGMAERGEIVPVVQGREVFKAAVTKMPEAVEQILQRNDLKLDDLRLLVMHQANLRINEAVQLRLGLPDDRVFNNIQTYGNTTAATLPLAFHQAREQRQLKAGDLVAFTAVGSGLNWGAALYRIWSPIAACQDLQQRPHRQEAVQLSVLQDRQVTVAVDSHPVHRPGQRIVPVQRDRP